MCLPELPTLFFSNKLFEAFGMPIEILAQSGEEELKLPEALFRRALCSGSHHLRHQGGRLAVRVDVHLRLLM